MPAVPQSLVPYSPLGRPNYGDGTSYTNSIDACLAVGGQVSGSLAVVPSSPASMSVRVDTGFNVSQIGQADPVYFNAGGALTSVALVVPGTNSYWACVYWDVSAATAGVVYGPSAVTPVRVYPDSVWQIPLAFVLIANTASTITAVNIYDARQWIANVNKSVNLGTIATNPTVNCNGATNVTIYVVSTNAAGVTIALTNLRYGVPVNIAIGNNSGSALLTKVTATTPSGVVIPVIYKFGATFGQWNTTGLSIGIGVTVVSVGNSVPNQLTFVVN